MPVLRFGESRLVGDCQPVLVIAEIGQNHQGDVEIALRMIEEAAQAGVDCVKFQKSSLQHKYAASVLSRRYDSPNSFGDTYGEHKAFLELPKNAFHLLKDKAASHGLLMSASAMDEVALDFLVELGVPFIKIGSGDSNNLRLIHKAAKTNIPLIISTGMSDLSAVERLYEASSKPLGLLQCTSAYPSSPADANLRVLSTYAEKFQDAVIGYSGHEKGFVSTLGAVAREAKIIERHFTLDKQLKGSDHQCSLNPQEMAEMVKQIRQLELALGSAHKTFLDCERPCFAKLGKSLVASRDICQGEVFTIEHLRVKVVEPHGWCPLKEHQLLGRIASKFISKDGPITEDCVQ
ncbi:sialic acid synthase-like [Varroa jacobsoni]|uniref:AFP-like domain-containing protein n=1 Tax=Varroa destructor TaxID=109461 RepID=A0A7M7K1H3_VARDE|nr:sialic acid synthase-like isoform X2 [Varroa destructor]XP_022685904.1 sialic acid synthase-like [Varroa jacobsoni]